MGSHNSNNLQKGLTLQLLPQGFAQHAVGHSTAPSKAWTPQQQVEVMKPHLVCQEAIIRINVPVYLVKEIPKSRGTILGVPIIITTIVFWGLYRGPLFWETTIQ